MDEQYLEHLRRTYKAGNRLRCICMEDLHGVPFGVEGTVQFVDDAGNVHMRWDNGSTLSYLSDVDKVEVVEQGG